MPHIVLYVFVYSRDDTAVGPNDTIGAGKHITHIRTNKSHSWLLGKAWFLPQTPQGALCAFLSLLQGSDMKMSIMGLLSHPLRIGHTERHDGRWLSGASGLIEPPPLRRCLDCLDQWLRTDPTTQHTHINICCSSYGMCKHWPVSVCTEQQTTFLCCCFSSHKNTVLSLCTVYTLTNILLTGWSEGLVHSRKSLALEQQKVLCAPSSRLLNLHWPTYSCDGKRSGILA